MAVSRSTKISILLAIDLVFFFVELIAGMSCSNNWRYIPLTIELPSFRLYCWLSRPRCRQFPHAEVRCQRLRCQLSVTTHDADLASHPFSSDVMSLVVALYAIKLTQNNVASAEYSYGWHRAEILAALINGVFLLALCFSIFIEAIERFFSVPGNHNFLPYLRNGFTHTCSTEVGNPKLVVIVGSLGLLSNFVGLFLFHGMSQLPLAWSRLHMDVRLTAPYLIPRVLTP